MTQSINRVHPKQELKTEYDKSVYRYYDGIWTNTNYKFHKLQEFKLFDIHTISNIDTEITNNTQYFLNDCVVYNNNHYICKNTHILSSDDKSGTALNSKLWYNYESTISAIQNNDYIIDFDDANNIYKYSEEFSNSYWNFQGLSVLNKTQQEEEMIFPYSSPTKIGILSTDTSTKARSIGQYCNILMKKKYQLSCYIKTISSYRVRYVALLLYNVFSNEYYSVVFDLNNATVLKTEVLDINYNVKSSPTNAFSSLSGLITKLSATDYRIGMSATSNYDGYICAQLNILSDESTPKYKFAQSSGAYTCYVNSFQFSEYSENKTISELPYYIKTKGKELHYWVQGDIYQKFNNGYSKLTCNLYYFDSKPITIVSNGDLGIISSLVNIDGGAIFGKRASSTSSDKNFLYYDITNKCYVLKDREGSYKQVISVEDITSNQKIMMLDAMTYHQGQYETYFPSHTYHNNTDIKLSYGINTGGCYNWRLSR